MVICKENGAWDEHWKSVQGCFGRSKEGLSEQVTFELEPGGGRWSQLGKELWEKPSLARQ